MKSLKIIALVCASVLPLSACIEETTATKEVVTTTPAQEEVVVETVEVETPAAETVKQKVVSFKADMVHFATDSARLTAVGQEKLSVVGRYLEANPNAKLKIEGYTDRRGSSSYNMVLGKRRAVAVKNYLESLGVEPLRLQTVSFGKSNPIAKGNNAKSYAENRRAEFFLLSH